MEADTYVNIVKNLGVKTMNLNILMNTAHIFHYMEHIVRVRAEDYS